MPKMCPQCGTSNSGFAEKCACGCDLTAVPATGPVAPDASTLSRPAPRLPLFHRLAVAGCFLAGFSTFLPLISVRTTRDVSPPNASERKAYDMSWYAPGGPGNTVLALVAATAVLASTRCPQGVLATGAALVAFAVPMLGWVGTGSGPGEHPHVAAARSEFRGWDVQVEFGWASWFGVVAGGVLWICSGALGLRSKN